MFEAVVAAVKGARPDVVVHLAAIAAPPQARMNPREAWEINVVGTLNLATAVRDLAPQARFFIVGSSEAYGGAFSDQRSPLSEEVRLDPRSTYGSTKAAADLLIGEMGIMASRLFASVPLTIPVPVKLPVMSLVHSRVRSLL